ncbi:MAG: alpha/beta fold hydrolase [Thermodesulfobacteriota bacterium]
MGKLTLGEIEIAYQISGRGDPLLLIGGFGMVKEAWGELATILSSFFQVITFDNRGVGESSVPETPFTIGDMAADAASLLNALGIDSAYVFGISMGGLIGQVMALDFTGRVKKLALGCTTHGGREAVAPSPDVMELLGKAADPTVPAEEAVRMRVPILFGERFLREHPDRLEAWVEMAVKYAPSPKGASAQMKALSRFNVRDRLGEIRCPVLVITGSEDRMMDPRNSELLAQRIPGARRYMVEGAGHLFFQERPREVGQVLKEFFQSSEECLKLRS